MFRSSVPGVAVGSERTTAYRMWSPKLFGVQTTLSSIVWPTSKSNRCGAAIVQPSSSHMNSSAFRAVVVPSLCTVTRTVVGLSSIGVPGTMSAALIRRSGHTIRVTVTESMLFRSFSSRNLPGSSGFVSGASTTTDTGREPSATPSGVQMNHAVRVERRGSRETV